jgi:hypothetical protein
MSIVPYTVAIIAVVLIAFVGTLLVAKNPADKNYGQTKRRLMNLTLIYVVGTAIALVGYYVYVTNLS